MRNLLLEDVKRIKKNLQDINMKMDNIVEGMNKLKEENAILKQGVKKMEEKKSRN